MPTRRAVVRLLLGVTLLTAPACDPDLGFSPFTERQRLVLARDRWIDRAPESYAFTMQLTCFCVAIQPMRVTVVNGAVVSVRPVGSDEELDARYRGPFVPIPELFELVSSAIDRPAYRIQAEYDPVLGFPTDVFIDYMKDAVDEEYGFLVHGVTLP